MIYLDNAATTKPFRIVIDHMTMVMNEYFGNPSSLHRLGVKAAEVLQSARKTLADEVNVSPEAIIFTSGATEANQTVMKYGVHKSNKKRNHILLSLFEHPSTLSAKKYLEELGYEVEFIIPNSEGIISQKSIAEKTRDTTELISIIGVHNEIGVIQDIKQIKQLINEINPNTLFHVDGVQWFGKIPMLSSNDMPDYFTLSAHKFHGPRGVGAIIKSSRAPLKPLIEGGGQESKYRSGTENLPAIAGMATAIESLHSLSTNDLIKIQKKLFNWSKNKKGIEWIGPEPGVNKSPFINLLAIQNKKSEILIHQLEEKNIFVSSGSACSDKSNKNKEAINYLNLDNSFIDGMIRVSFGYQTTENDVDKFIEELTKLI